MPKTMGSKKGGDSARANKERFYQRRLTTAKKIIEMKSVCDADSLWIIRRKSKYYVLTTDPTDKNWGALLNEMV